VRLVTYAANLIRFFCCLSNIHHVLNSAPRDLETFMGLYACFYDYYYRYYGIISFFYFYHINLFIYFNIGIIKLLYHKENNIVFFLLFS
jgi:hypothetical protein